MANLFGLCCKMISISGQTQKLGLYCIGKNILKTNLPFPICKSHSVLMLQTATPEHPWGVDKVTLSGFFWRVQTCLSALWYKGNPSAIWGKWINQREGKLFSAAEVVVHCTWSSCDSVCDYCSWFQKLSPSSLWLFAFCSSHHSFHKNTRSQMNQQSRGFSSS